MISKTDKSDKKYSLINLNLFNRNNKDLIDKFIKFYNSLEIDNCKLSNKNLLFDFLIVDNIYMEILTKIFIKN